LECLYELTRIIKTVFITVSRFNKFKVNKKAKMEENSITRSQKTVIYMPQNRGLSNKLNNIIIK